MNKMPFTTVEERLAIYRKMLRIYRYMHKNNTSIVPRHMLFEKAIIGREGTILGFCHLQMVLLGFYQELLPELKEFEPDIYHGCSLWFPIEDYISRLNILEKLLAEHDNTTTNTELIMDK